MVRRARARQLARVLHAHARSLRARGARAARGAAAGARRRRGQGLPPAPRPALHDATSGPTRSAPTASRAGSTCSSPRAGMYVGTGYYRVEPDQLERFRAAVADDEAGPVLEAALAKARLDVAGASLKTAPRGYPRDHPRIELLRRKQLIVGKSLPAGGGITRDPALDARPRGAEGIGADRLAGSTSTSGEQGAVRGPGRAGPRRRSAPRACRAPRRRRAAVRSVRPPTVRSRAAIEQFVLRCSPPDGSE